MRDLLVTIILTYIKTKPKDDDQNVRVKKRNRFCYEIA